MTSNIFEQFRSIARSRVEDVATLAQRICEVPAPTGERANERNLWRRCGENVATHPKSTRYTMSTCDVAHTTLVPC